MSTAENIQFGLNEVHVAKEVTVFNSGVNPIKVSISGDGSNDFCVINPGCCETWKRKPSPHHLNMVYEDDDGQRTVKFRMPLLKGKKFEFKNNEMSSIE